MNVEGGGGVSAAAASVASVERRAAWAIALASAAAAADAVSSVLFFAGSRHDDSLLGTSAAAFGALGVAVGMALFVASAVAYFLWLHRAVGCAHALAPPPHAHAATPGQAVLAYFIPIVHLARPHDHMRRLSLALDPLALPEPPAPAAPAGDYRSSGRSPAVEARWPEDAPVTLWWGAWLVFNVGANVSLRSFDEDPLAHVIIAALAIAVAVPFVLVVRSVSLRLRELARRRSVPLPPRPFYA